MNEDVKKIGCFLDISDAVISKGCVWHFLNFETESVKDEFIKSFSIPANGFKFTEKDIAEIFSEVFSYVEGTVTLSNGGWELENFGTWEILFEKEYVEFFRSNFRKIKLVWDFSLKKFRKKY